MRLFLTTSLIGLLAFFVINVLPSNSQLTDDELTQKREEIKELQEKLVEVRGQKQTLASTISYLNNRIQLTQAQIDESQAQVERLQVEIADLSTRIQLLDATLEDITKILINRIGQTYKQSRVQPLYQVFMADTLPEALTRVKYLQLSQKNDREVMYQMETTKADFNNQKLLKEEKQAELDLLAAQLEQQQLSLSQQQEEKEALLEITRNDELRFQAELATKRAELEAIQSIIAGRGEETEVGDVSKGDQIAMVIPGASACSSGAHLHFEVANQGVHRNPAGYLSSKAVVWDNGPDSPFEFTGDWDWPLSGSVRITQGYGMTFYAATMRYYGGGPHTGIDMVNNSDYTVKSVSDGKLFRGAIACGGGTLRYVRVAHNDELSSYYLHVNY